MQRIVLAIAVLALFSGCGEQVSREAEDAVSVPLDDIYGAAKRNDLQAVAQFVAAQQWDHMVPDADGNMVIHYAALNGNVEMLTLLLDAGFTYTVRDSDNRTPLQVAEAAGKTEAAAYLRQRGAQE